MGCCESDTETPVSTKIGFFLNSQETINFSKETLRHVVNQLIIEIEVSGFSRAESSRDVQGCVQRVDLTFVESC